jgi:putative FmdB family regulatory protein
MPHYVFICRECKKEFEKVLHIDELGSSTVQCPECGSTKVEQAVSAFSAVTSKKS